MPALELKAKGLEVRECAWSEVWPEGLALFRAHEKEIGVEDDRIPLDIDEGRCRTMYQMGVLRIVGAFQTPLYGRPRLAGYLFWYVSPSILSMQTMVADQGPWYVVPELRRTPLGFRLFAASVEMLKRAGVRQVLTHRSEHSPRGIEKIFERFGAKRLEEVWEIKL